MTHAINRIQRKLKFYVKLCLSYNRYLHNNFFFGSIDYGISPDIYLRTSSIFINYVKKRDEIEERKKL